MRARAASPGAGAELFIISSFVLKKKKSTLSGAFVMFFGAPARAQLSENRGRFIKVLLGGAKKKQFVATINFTKKKIFMRKVVFLLLYIKSVCLYKSINYPRHG